MARPSADRRMPCGRLRVGSTLCCSSAQQLDAVSPASPLPPWHLRRALVELSPVMAVPVRGEPGDRTVPVVFGCPAPASSTRRCVSVCPGGDRPRLDRRSRSPLPAARPASFETACTWRDRGSRAAELGQGFLDRDRRYRVRTELTSAVESLFRAVAARQHVQLPCAMSGRCCSDAQRRIELVFLFAHARRVPDRTLPSAAPPWAATLAADLAAALAIPARYLLGGQGLGASAGRPRPSSRCSGWPRCSCSSSR